MQKPIDQRFVAMSALGQTRTEHVLRCSRIVPIVCESADASACRSDDGFEGQCHSRCLEIGEFWLG